MHKKKFHFTISFGILFFISEFTLGSNDFPFGHIDEFTTDGCTIISSGTKENPTLWLDCCVQHDLRYWSGGTSIERKQADEEVYNCVANKGEPEIAFLMYNSVRLGAGPYVRSHYRWGYGWKINRGYSPLSEAEAIEVKNLTPKDLAKVPITKPHLPK